MKQQLLFVVAFAFAGAAFGSLPVSRAALAHGGRLVPLTDAQKRELDALYDAMMAF